MPGAGKTYYAVRKMLKAMKRGHKKYFFSNVPIYHKKYGWSLCWKPEYAKQQIVDAEILIDEAYRDYNSRNSTKKKGDEVFTKDEHTFFATNRHLNNDIWLIAHNPARIDVAIREITEEFLMMHCHKIPILDIPLWFSCDVYLDEQSIALRYTSRTAKYCTERFRFSRAIAKVYDTHFYRPPEIPEVHFDTWGEVLGLEAPGIPLSPENISQEIDMDETIEEDLLE